MTKEAFLQLMSREIVLLDGATGTNLMAAGMPSGVCPEQWICEHRQVMLDLQAAYVKAGSKIILAPTFSANQCKLAEYGLAKEVRKLNHDLVGISKEAAQGRAYVAGNLTMTGRSLYPVGELLFEDLVDIYKEQIYALCESGIDLLMIETMMSLQEARAAILAAKETAGLPIMVSLTFEADGRTLYGTDPKTAVNVLQSLGADVVGANCSFGPEEMAAIIREMKKIATVPILAKPNAGLPVLADGKTVYLMEAEKFAASCRLLMDAGATVIGGCCGTTPQHIAALAKEAAAYAGFSPKAQQKRLLSSERKTIEIAAEGSCLIVGERINPTGKKKLQHQLREGSFELVRTMAREQEEDGAAVLDINVGINGIDEKQVMLEAVYEVTQVTDCPLCIDSSHIEVIEAALRIYPGRALINSISYEKEKCQRLLAIAKKYGAMFILLPLSDNGLPKDAREKRKNIDAVFNAALAAGLTKEDIVVDGLVATVGANPKAALECFDTIHCCKQELGLATICGLSNISFGLPGRPSVNAAFLTMAIFNGLSMAIANPSQDLLVNAAYSSDLLLCKEDGERRYLERMKHLKELGAEEDNVQGLSYTGEQKKEPAAKEESGRLKVFEAVVKGEKKAILPAVDVLLLEGAAPQEIIDKCLIPAINEVGDLFDRQVYFLPQLISSARTMEQAVDYLKPMLPQRSEDEQLPVVIIATVEGDIHDIGKNLVVLMLKNHGYRVVDLGKDVPTEQIVDAAIQKNAAVIGLSALMTTTMMRMKDVVALAKKKGCKSRIVIGGAAVNESFADEIGADGYSKDAADCVKLVERLLKTKKE